MSSSELLDYAFDLVLLGNSISKKDDVYQILSNAKVQFISAPEWLSEYVLTNRKVLVVSGTHGKTTVSALLAWIFLNLV